MKYIVTLSLAAAMIAGLSSFRETTKLQSAHERLTKRISTSNFAHTLSGVPPGCITTHYGHVTIVTDDGSGRPISMSSTIDITVIDCLPHSPNHGILTRFSGTTCISATIKSGDPKIDALSNTPENEARLIESINDAVDDALTNG